MELTFKKLAGRWFIDIPWDGNIGDLEMVAGADTLLENLSNDESEVKIILFESPRYDSISLYLEDMDSEGATYFTTDPELTLTIWLCNVTKHVLGEFPQSIHFKVL